MKKLTAKNALFVAEYLVDLDGAKAARRVGYSDRTAARIAYSLLQRPEIQAAIAEANAARIVRTQIDADYVLNKIRDTVERCAQEQPVLDAEGQPTGEYKFDASNVLKGCELLGKHLAMWTDKVKHEGTIEFLSAASDDEIDRTIAQLAAKAGVALGDAGAGTTH